MQSGKHVDWRPHLHYSPKKTYIQRRNQVPRPESTDKLCLVFVFYIPLCIVTMAKQGYIELDLIECIFGPSRSLLIVDFFQAVLTFLYSVGLFENFEERYKCEAALNASILNPKITHPRDFLFRLSFFLLPLNTF